MGSAGRRGGRGAGQGRKDTPARPHRTARRRVAALRRGAAARLRVTGVSSQLGRIYISMCRYIYTLAYAQRGHAAVGDRLSGRYTYVIYTYIYTHAHISTRTPVRRCSRSSSRRLPGAGRFPAA